MSKTITLKSSDGESFVIDEAVALESQTIKHMIQEEDCVRSEIPLQNVTSATLTKVIEYCKKHSAAAADAGGKDIYRFDGDVDKELKTWDADFVKVDQDTLFDIMLAANYLNIRGLLDLTCQTVADMMREKTPTQIRQLFNIKNDYTPEEEAELRKEHEWAFL